MLGTLTPLGQHREQLVDSLQTPRPCPPELAADEQVLLDRERRKKPAPFGNQRDAARDHRMRGRIPDRLALEQDGVAAGSHGAGDAFEQRRFAGAVGADDGNHLAGHNVEGDAEQRLEIAVEGVERAHIEERLRHRRGSPYRSRALRAT